MMVLSLVAWSAAAAHTLPAGGRRVARTSLAAVDAALVRTPAQQRGLRVSAQRAEPAGGTPAASLGRGLARAPSQSRTRGLRASAPRTEPARAELVATLSAMTEHCTPASADDVACIEERQLKHPISAMIAVGHRCKYGFPQALALDPLGREKYALGGHPVDAALFRLTCPHLVKAIDEWEAEGAVRAFNKDLAADAEWARSNDAVNAQHRLIRHALVGSEEKRAELERHPVLSIILNSGLAGLTKPGDVKCLHAQVADSLCRGDNAVANAVLAGLRERGVDPEGGCSCWQQCDLKHELGPESWQYQPVKNRQKLKATAERRRKLNSAGKARRAAAAPVVESGAARSDSVSDAARPARRPGEASG